MTTHCIGNDHGRNGSRTFESVRLLVLPPEVLFREAIQAAVLEGHVLVRAGDRLDHAPRGEPTEKSEDLLSLDATTESFFDEMLQTVHRFGALETVIVPTERPSSSSRVDVALQVAHERVPQLSGAELVLGGLLLCDPGGCRETGRPLYLPHVVYATADASQGRFSCLLRAGSLYWQ